MREARARSLCRERQAANYILHPTLHHAFLALIQVHCELIMTVYHCYFMIKQAIRLFIVQMPLRLVCTCSDATVRLLSPGSGECITTMLLPSMSIIADVAYAAAEST